MLLDVGLIPEKIRVATKTIKPMTARPPMTGAMNLKGELLTGGATTGCGGWYAGGTTGFSSGGGRVPIDGSGRGNSLAIIYLVYQESEEIG